MGTKDVLLVVLPIITSFLTYQFALRTKKSEAILKFKEEKYANLLTLLQGFVGKTANSERKRQFFEEQYKSWLYSSDGVVKAVNAMVALLINDSRQRQRPEEWFNARQYRIGNAKRHAWKNKTDKSRLQIH